MKQLTIPHGLQTTKTLTEESVRSLQNSFNCGLMCEDDQKDIDAILSWFILNALEEPK